MEVIDTLGIKNYTFKILNHPEDNYKTFHNLVLTEKENSLEVTVLKYEMSDFFAQQFDNAPETFINFEGTITSRGLVTSPCDELIIDFPRNGNPGSGGGGGSGGCTQVDISFVCDNCNRSYGNWDTYSGSVCGNGNYGLTIVITYTNLSYMNCRLASDPCDPDGSVGVLLPIDASRAFYRGLTPAQKLWWNNNPDESALITRYLEDNDYSAESETFAQWATTFFINNPDTTWGQFENWFMGTVDLDNNSIGGYDNTTYQMVNPNNLQQDWPTIESVIPLSDFVGFRDELTSDGTRYLSCMDFAKEQIAKKGYSISNYDAPGQTFQVYTESNGVDVNALWEGISYLKYALSNGIPVIVGIDNRIGSPNPYTDNTTDHFVVIVGTGVNLQGEIYFRFFDNATNYSSQGASPYNMLFLDNILNMLVGQTEVATYRNNFTDYNYIVTQIRKSK